MTVTSDRSGAAAPEGSVPRARYIAFEGGEASGKSTQAARLAAAIGALPTREPGGTEIGRQLRELLLDPATTDLAPRAEALLMAADRAQHHRQVVLPALGRGQHVVTDRSAYSSLAYQGYGRGLPLDELRTLSDWALEGVWPDLAVVLVVDATVAAARLDRALDRMEREGPDFHDRVAAGFRALADEEPDRIVVLDGSGSIGEVAGRVREVVRDRLELDV